MWNVIVLGITSFLTDISSEMAYPLLPLFLASLPGVSSGTLGLVVGVVEGVAESTASLMKVFSGRRADRTGRRKPLAIMGYAGSMLGKLCFVLASAWPMVLLGRVVDRFGKGIRTAPRDALLADSAPPDARGRTFGLHRLMDTLGALIGVLLAYALMPSDTNTKAPIAFTQIFLWSLVPAGLGVAVLLLVREPLRGSSARSSGADADAIAGGAGSMRAADTLTTVPQRSLVARFRALDPQLQGFLLVAFLFTLGNSSNQFLLLRATSVGFGAKTVLLLYAVYNIAYAVLAYPAGRLSDRLGRRALLVAGYSCYGLVYFGFGITGHAAMWPLFASYGAYIALTEGVEKALVTDLAPLHLRATLLGLHATIVGIGLLPASLIAGALYGLSPQAPFVFGGMIGLLSAVGMAVVLRVREPQRRGT